MPSRNIKARPIPWRITQDRRVNALSGPWPMLAYTWLISCADNLGRMEGDADLLAGILFPLQSDVTPALMADILQELHDLGLVYWYEVDGARYLQFHPDRWADQRLVGNMTNRSTFPAPEEGTLAKWAQEAKAYTPPVGKRPASSESAAENGKPSGIKRRAKSAKRREDVKSAVRAEARTTRRVVPGVPEEGESEGEGGSFIHVQNTYEHAHTPDPPETPPSFADAQVLARALYDALKERDALPADKHFYMGQVRYAERVLLPQRPLQDWLDCLEWALKDAWWRDKLDSVRVLGNRVWSQYARAMQPQVRVPRAFAGLMALAEEGEP